MIQPAFPFGQTPRQRHLFTTGLRFLFACCLLQAPGCMHRPEPASPAPKPATAEKPGTSRPAGSQAAEQSEKKPSAQKEKKTAVSSEKKPGKKPEQPEESGQDMPAPPPPLRPPTFGGAGG
jgi:hypothetical protein